jgi:hypothetical protein
MDADSGRQSQNARKILRTETIPGYTVPKAFSTLEQFHSSTENVSRTTMKFSAHLNFPYYSEMFYGSTGSCSWLFFSRSTMKTT